MATDPVRREPLLAARRNGWYLVCHPAFRDPLLELQARVARLEQEGLDWENSPWTKLLRRIVTIILEEIPADPGSPKYEQGNTLGADARGWRRAKFLRNRMRLFFRFDTKSRVIVYAWVNDEETLRKAGASTDPYAVFRAMLVKGDPPSGWENLLDACRAPADAPHQQELGELLGGIAPLQVPDKPEPEPAKKARKTKRVRGGN